MTGDDPLDLWHGRADPDGETGRRWHEIVRPFAEHPQAQAVPEVERIVTGHRVVLTPCPTTAAVRRHNA